MSKNHLYVDIHVLQTVPPSCVNRDDTGSPETAVYGGVRRARVSSQAWKRAIRVAFREMYTPDDLAVRTRRIVNLVKSHIEAISTGENSEEAAVKALEAAGLKIEKLKRYDEPGVEALFFMSDSQAKALAHIAVNEPEKLKDKEACRSALKDNPSVDQALFGRMVASDPSLNYDAAAQVAHAISTHRVQNEFDYFTAVDDLSPKDDAGAGHLGTVEFNSSTLYRYATVNVEELFLSLGESTAAAVRNFVDAFVYSMPTGKQNTFANRTLPELVYVTVRCDQPVNFAGAFEQPVPVDSMGGYVASSVKRMTEYAGKVYKNYADVPVRAWIVGAETEGAVTLPSPELLKTVEAFLGEELSKG